MLIFYNKVDLDVGFDVLSRPKKDRIIGGREVSAPGGLSLYAALRQSNQPLKCWSCGIEATCFIANKHPNDVVSKPVLDLFAEDNGFVLMTRDHIIPRSLGGSNAIANLRVGCSPCNGERGNMMNDEDREFMALHPELVIPLVSKSDNLTTINCIA